MSVRIASFICYPDLCHGAEANAKPESVAGASLDAGKKNQADDAGEEDQNRLGNFKADQNG